MSNSPLLEVKQLKTYYKTSTGFFNKKSEVVKAVDDVSLSIQKGEVLGLVGESGSGKSTLGRTIMGLEALTSGEVLFEGKSIRNIDRVELAKQIQYVFQDPYSSLNPRLTVHDTLKEVLLVHRMVEKSRLEGEINRLLDLVGISKAHQHRFPHQFSGGQRQRIGIARALAVKPKMLICDEPVSALDVSIQAQILNLFKDLQQELSLTYLFIAHGLGAVKYVSNRIAVMYKGKIVELNTTQAIFNHAEHEYTQMLLQSYPIPNPRLRRITVNNEIG